MRGVPYRLNLLDTAGQERFRTLSNSYYRGAHAVILVYDISNRDSFLSMARWFDEVESNAIPGCVMWLVGAKMDMERAGKRKVSAEEGESLARERGCEGFCEVSRKTREGVRTPFLGVVEAVVRNPELLKAGRRGKGTVDVGGSEEGWMGSVCSC